MGAPDPVLSFLSLREVVGGSALLELLVALVLLGHKRLAARDRFALIVWLATVMCIYRLALHSSGFRGACPCLGIASAWLASNSVVINLISGLLLGFLLIGGCVGLLRSPRAGEDERLVVARGSRE